MNIDAEIETVIGGLDEYINNYDKVIIDLAMEKTSQVADGGDEEFVRFVNNMRIFNCSGETALKYTTAAYLIALKETHGSCLGKSIEDINENIHDVFCYAMERIPFHIEMRQ